MFAVKRVFFKASSRAGPLCKSAGQRMNFSTLILAEHLDGTLNKNFGSCLTAAGELKDPEVDVLVHGSDASCQSQVEALKLYSGINKIYTAKDAGLENPYGQAVAQIAANLIKSGSYTNVIAASSSFGKDAAPRIGGLLDLQAITDIVQILEDGAKFVRPIYAGNALCTVSTRDPIRILTVRGTNFDAAKQGDAQDYSVEEIQGIAEIMGVQAGSWVENLITKSEMADLTSAEIVVSGGRALKTGENFSLLQDIAETLGKSRCAIGASRAAVDAGMCANDMQIGQTGKVVAPSIYFAIGISGAIQHVSGMKDSKVIVAINKDADAPIFKIANYGLVGDLFKILPELNEKLKAI